MNYISTSIINFVLVFWYLADVKFTRFITEEKCNKRDSYKKLYLRKNPHKSPYIVVAHVRNQSNASFSPTPV